MYWLGMHGYLAMPTAVQMQRFLCFVVSQWTAAAIHTHLICVLQEVMNLFLDPVWTDST